MNRFFYSKDLQKLTIDFVINLEFLPEKSSLEMRTKFQVKRVVNERISKSSTENFEYEDECIEDTDETDL